MSGSSCRKISVPTEQGLVEVAGQSIQFDGYSDFDFVLYKINDLFYIQDMTSGVFIPFANPPQTEEEAMDIGVATLNQSNQSTLRNTIRTTLLKVVFHKDEES